MNVLHLIGSFEQGGSEAQALQLARLQRQQGVNIYLACFDRSGPLLSQAEKISSEEISAFPLRSFSHPSTLPQFLRFIRHLRRCRIDVVQTHDFYTNVFGLPGAAVANVKARVGARRETFGFRTDQQKKVEHFAYRSAHFVVANSQAVRLQLINENVPESKILVIYNGIDPRRVQASLNNDKDEIGVELLGKTCFVTLVANMRHPVKDHPMFLRVAQRVLAEIPDAGFVIAGEGELSQQTKDQAQRAGLGKDVFFTGRCADISKLLAASDVCVLTSKAEGFSNVILEYMAAGRPVVATDVGGAREAIVEAETGYLVPAGDDKLMAERIISLLKNKQRGVSMGNKGQAIVLQKFSCETQVESFMNLYERILGYRSQRASPAIEMESSRVEPSQ